MTSAVRQFGFFVLWIMMLVFMIFDLRADLWNPAWEGTQAYGHNHPGEFLKHLLLSVCELLIVYCVIRPKSYRQSWRRVLLGLFLFIPWTFCLALSGMHAGGIHMIHALWLYLINLIFGILLFMIAVEKIYRRCSQRE